MIISCNTYPNDKLLQQKWRTCISGSQVVIPTLTISFYNKTKEISSSTTKTVVIPTLTISFYNECGKKLLFRNQVVIPTLTISFYNIQLDKADQIRLRCNTYPNDKLLQHHGPRPRTSMSGCCNTYPNDKLLQHFIFQDFGKIDKIL